MKENRPFNRLRPPLCFRALAPLKVLCRSLRWCQGTTQVAWRLSPPSVQRWRQTPGAYFASSASGAFTKASKFGGDSAEATRPALPSRAAKALGPDGPPLALCPCSAFGAPRAGTSSKTSQCPSCFFRRVSPLERASARVRAHPPLTPREGLLRPARVRFPRRKPLLHQRGRAQRFSCTKKNGRLF